MSHRHRGHGKDTAPSSGPECEWCGLLTLDEALCAHRHCGGCRVESKCCQVASTNVGENDGAGQAASS